MTRGHTYLASGCAAAWVPPDVELLDWRQAADYASLLDEELGAWSDTVLSTMTELHALRPIDPHFHLLLLGTDPATQRQGRATRLLERVLRICDTDGFPAYLESTNPKTAGIYRRLSFRSVGYHRLPNGPGVELLRRDPVAPADG